MLARFCKRIPVLLAGGLAAVLLMAVNTGPGSVGIAAAGKGASYIDLRRIEPVHGDVAAGAQKAVLCQACHAASGVSRQTNFPRLAGQRPDYLYYRLVSYHRAYGRANSRDPYYGASPMTPLTASLSDADMRDLAAYYGAQTPDATDVAPATPAAEKGQALFLSGDPTRGVPPCQGCHGEHADGLATRQGQYATYPGLRGQYVPYVVARLTAFRRGLPHDTTNDFIMADVARGLDDASIQAVAEWLATLTPARSL